MFAVQADGRDVRTVESLAKEGQLNELQRAFTENFALQCGYCTPGVLMTATALISENKKLADEEIKRYMVGNLCRCTGYIPIVEAIKHVQEERERRLVKQT
jgi:aerobic-type carbon monoxide dehydrogenase small subunit (CoxS/CutS family)